MQRHFPGLQGDINSLRLIHFDRDLLTSREGIVGRIGFDLRKESLLVGFRDDSETAILRDAVR